MILRLLIVFFALCATAAAQITRAPTLDELMRGGGKLVPMLEKRMTKEQLDAFLRQRTMGAMIGKFSEYTSLLWATGQVAIWCTDPTVEKTYLQSPFPEDYRPTWKELLDVLARQVNCSWRYNHDTGYWEFTRKTMPWPFTIIPADGWRSREQGNQIVYVPPIAPIGMDVYVMGHFSADNPALHEAIFSQARKHVSDMFAQNFKPNLSAADFSWEQVAGEKAMYFECYAPQRPSAKWRQWAFVKNGWCILVVSVIEKENETRLYPDVQRMIATIEVE